MAFSPRSRIAPRQLAKARSHASSAGALRAFGAPLKGSTETRSKSSVGREPCKQRAEKVTDHKWPSEQADRRNVHPSCSGSWRATICCTVQRQCAKSAKTSLPSKPWFWLGTQSFGLLPQPSGRPSRGPLLGPWLRLPTGCSARPGPAAPDYHRAARSGHRLAALARQPSLVGRGHVRCAPAGLCCTRLRSHRVPSGGGSAAPAVGLSALPLASPRKLF